MSTITRTSLEHTANGLAYIADCYSPDSTTSAGAALLLSVQDSVNCADITPQDTEDTMEDIVHEIADGAPDVYTHQMWLEFIDLGAYQEDVTEYGEPESMEHGARVALFIICERLAQALTVERLELLQRECDCTDDEFCDKHPEGEGRDV